MGFLALYGWLVCVAGKHFMEQQQEVSIVWAGLIMLVGLVGLLKTVIKGGRERLAWRRRPVRGPFL